MIYLGFVVLVWYVVSQFQMENLESDLSEDCRN